MAKLRSYVKGHTGVLSVQDATAFKPIVCLVSSSMSRVAEMIEKINFCTEGETQSSVDRINREVSFEAEIVDDLESTETGYDEMVTLMETKEEHLFRLDGRGSAQYFNAVISSLDDNFTAGEDATFSGTITINSVESAPTGG